MGFDAAEYRMLDATAIAARVAGGGLAADAVLAAALTSIDDAAATNALARRYAPPVTADARAAPLRSDAPLRAVPIVLKDLGANSARHPAGDGLPPLPRRAGASDSALFSQLLASGAVVLGRSTVPELAADVATYSPAHGPTRNPYDLRCSPGGSSGGSAALVAARAVPIAHATDAAGSIRVPAARCGLVGLKPTRGTLSSAPDPAPFCGFAEQFFLTRTARDSLRLLRAFSAQSFAAAPHGGRGRLRTVATVDSSALPRTPDDACARATAHTVETLAALGYDVRTAQVRLPVPWTEYLDAFVDVWATQIRRTVDDLAIDDPATVLSDRIITIDDYGRGIPERRYLDRLDRLAEIGRDVLAALEEVDVVVSPVTTDHAVPAIPPAALDGGLSGREHLLATMLACPLVSLANVTGTPAVSTPSLREGPLGHPVGTQLWSRAGSYADLLSVVAAVETVVRWDRWRPDAQPEMPVRSTPAAIHRCATRKNARSGAMDTTAAANIAGTSTDWAVT